MLLEDVRAAPTEAHVPLETQPEIPLTGTSLKSGPYGSSWLLGEDQEQPNNPLQYKHSSNWLWD